MTDSLEPITVEELVRRYTPELIPRSEPGLRVILQATAFSLVASVTLSLLAAAGFATSAATLVLAGIAGVPAAAGVGWLENRQRRRFTKELKDSPWIFYDAVAVKFAAEIERQRARTIGPSSEWGRARLRLEDAGQEADRSVAYWTQRLSREPGSELAQTQLAAATRLQAKFHTALADLDQRARVLVAFFNDCEARIAVLQSTKRDYEEIRKLEALTDRSEDLVTHAEETLVSIGSTFISEALRVANALGSLERIGLANLAGEVPVDQLEALADRILESAESDRTALERVAGSI